MAKRKRSKRVTKVDGKPARKTAVNARDKNRMAKWFAMRKALESAMRELRGKIDEVIGDYARKGERLHHYDIDTGELVYVKVPKKKPADKTPPADKDDKKKGAK